MTHRVDIAELSQTQNRLRDGRKSSASNLDLADQLQFSSVLRTQMDGAQQGLESVQDAATQRMQAARAQGKQQGADPTDPAPKRAAPDRDRKPQSTERNDGVRAARPKFSLPQQQDAETKAPAAAKTTDDAPAPVADKAAAATAPVVSDAKSDVPVQAAAPVVAPLVQTIKTDDAPKTDESAPEALSSVLNEMRGAKPNDGNSNEPVQAEVRAMHERTVGALADQAVQGPDTHSLKATQEIDLANRLDSSSPVQISVDTGASAAVQPMPMSQPLLSTDTQRAAFSFKDAAVNPAGDQSTNQPTTDRQDPSTHGDLALPQTTAAAIQQPQPDLLSSVLSAQASAAVTNQTAAETEAQAGPVELAPVGAVGATQAPAQTAPATKAAPAAPAKQPEKPQAPAEQIAVKIRQAVGEGLDKINIKLHPAELGRIEVKLDVAKDGSVTATVLAEKPETLDLLQKDQRGLQQALTDSGLKVDSANLNFGLQGQQQQLADTGRDRRTPYSRNDARTIAQMGATGDMPAMPIGAVYGRNLRSNGGVDIRV